MMAIRKYKNYIPLLFLALIINSCNKQEIEEWDEAYVHIMTNNRSEIKVNSNRKDVVSYYIYYSSKMTSKDLEITYSIDVGNGLTEGVDFDIITTENPLLFPSGIYKRPIQIRWMAHEVSPTKDNTITIKIESTSRNINIGLPGPDQNQSEFIIEKINS